MLEYEIEIKSLLGTQEKADNFRSHILERGAVLTGKNQQLNHYFIGNSYEKLKDAVKEHLSNEAYERLFYIVEHGEAHSLRTRELDGIVKLVIKASVDDTTSENGIARMEFEEILPLTLVELDQLLVDSGFSYQAKWSRYREEYSLDNITISLDKNAGYGWLTEFESVIKEGDDRHEAEAAIRSLMESCAVIELPQERLARMFAYYNDNWEDYYGTDKVFEIE